MRALILMKDCAGHWHTDAKPFQYTATQEQIIAASR